MTVLQIITIVLGCAGIIFMLLSLLGIVRFPDFFTRLHAQGVGDTIGAMLIIGGMIVATGLNLLSAKLVLIFFVIMLTNPLGTNMMIIAEMYKMDYLDYTKTTVDEEKKIKGEEEKKEDPAEE